MRWFRFAALILVATILQTSVVGVMALRRPDIKPDLMLICLVFFATAYRGNDAVISSFAIGFAADLINPTMGLMGPQIISFGLFGTVLSDLHHFVSVRRIGHQMIVVLIVGAVTGLASYLLTFLRAEPVATHVLAKLLWRPLYSAALAPLLFLPMAWWMGINTTKRRRSKRL